MRTHHATALLAASVLLTVAACGDDDDDAAADTAAEIETPTVTGAPAETEAPPETHTPVDTEPPVETEAPTVTDAPPEGDEQSVTEPAVCEPYLDVSAVFAGEPDPATIEGLLDEVEATAPDEIAEPLGVLVGGARVVLENGDFSVFESPEFNDAVATSDRWIFDNCDFTGTAELTATEYQYAGQSAEYPAGRNGFTLVNDGVEAHELILLRKGDGVELSLEDLMELPESEAETMTAYVGGVFVGPPGESGVLVADLEPGDYIAVCNIPAGTIANEDGSFTEGTGEPHVMLGMSFEFTVG